MESLIKDGLKKLEAEHDVKVLFAVESGSRAWGFESPDSDYDVRFIYVNKPEWYLNLDEKRDVIELMTADNLDYAGWDLKKALKLYRNFNPSLNEWLTSAIIYVDNYGFANGLRTLSKSYFSKRSSLNHYCNMAEAQYKTYLRNDFVKAKKYFYVLRPLLSCLWILDNESQPPILFNDLIRKTNISSEVREEIEKLIIIKKSSDEKNLIERNLILDKFIREWLEKVNDEKFVYVNEPCIQNTLQHFFFDVLKNVWDFKI